MTEQIDLVVIRRDGGTQSRARMDETVIAEYVAAWNEGIEFPPIVLYFDGKDYWLADGFHRVQSAIDAGRKDIAADVRQGTQRDAILHSVGANANHGLRRSNADKRRAVETLLRDEEWRHWSDREIARRCGVDNKTVASIRRELFPTEEIPQSRAGADGRVINTAKIGKPARPKTKLQIGCFVAVGEDVGLVIGVDNPRYPGSVCVKRDNFGGFMTHWITTERITYPLTLKESTIAAAKVFRWGSRLLNVYDLSRMNGGWFSYIEGVGLNQQADKTLRDELISAELIEYNGEYRITQKGCEWLGLPVLTYKSRFEDGQQVMTRAGERTVIHDDGSSTVLVKVGDGQQRIARSNITPAPAPTLEVPATPELPPLPTGEWNFWVGSNGHGYLGLDGRVFAEIKIAFDSNKHQVRELTGLICDLLNKHNDEVSIEVS